MPFDRSVNILVVDDHPTMRRVTRDLLRQIDLCRVEEAAEGAEALGRLRAGRFGLVISGWTMEPMTGIELLEEVRADARLAATPFLMMTVESRSESIAAAKRAGASNYIVKPFNAGVLRAKIGKVLEAA